jgi:hypothetical protein
MKTETVQVISKKIYRRFPEFKGVKPKVRSQQNSKTDTQTYLLTFATRAKVSEEHFLERWVRVVVDESGKIIKVSTSK